MNRLYLVVGVALVLIILASGCTTGQVVQEGVTCNKPYILIGNSCCFDGNDNGICDRDETTQEVDGQTSKDEVDEPEEEEVDLCAGVTCGDKCEATTKYYNGNCNSSTGECHYSTQENSAECGYAPPTLMIVEMGCRYQYSSAFTIHLKSVSETPIPIGSKIKLLFDDGRSVYYSIQREYSNGERLWYDTSMRSGWDTLGRTYNLTGINNSPFARKNQNYAYIYCPPEIEEDECNKDTGIVLYEGNALEDCDTDIRGNGYFTPYNDFIELTSEQSNKPTSDTQLLESFNLKKSDFPSGYDIVDRFSGFQTNAKYYSDLNKWFEKELIENGWIANHTITIAKQQLDPSLQLTLPSEQVYSSISKFSSRERILEEIWGDYERDAKIVEDKDRIIKEYERYGYRNTKIEQIDSNTVQDGKIYLFSTVDSEQSLGDGRYAVLRLYFGKGTYYVALSLKGYSDEITPERIDQYAKIILERIGNENQ